MHGCIPLWHALVTISSLPEWLLRIYTYLRHPCRDTIVGPFLDPSTSLANRERPSGWGPGMTSQQREDNDYAGENVPSCASSSFSFLVLFASVSFSIFLRQATLILCLYLASSHIPPEVHWPIRVPQPAQRMSTFGVNPREYALLHTRLSSHATSHPCKLSANNPLMAS